MLKMYRIISLLVIASALQGTNADSHSLGSCPDIDPLSGFKMNKFLGLWYAIQKTSTSTRCLMYNITEGEKPSLYELTEIEPHSTLVNGLYHEHRSTGVLNVTDPATPAKMALDLPLDIGTTWYTVFLTDYNNYAAVFTCKKYPLVHKWAVEILSRTPKLDMNYVDKVRTRISSYNVDPSTLSIIRQDCPPPGSKGGLIKTASNVANAIGETISDINNPPTP